MRLLGLLLLVVVGSGCATLPEGERSAQDPWESYNRTMFSVNAGVDKVAIKPVTQAYRFVSPQFVETGVSNFFANLGDVPNMFNNFLQGKFEAGGNDLMRFLTNSTIGLGGLIDIASEAGMPKHDEDFGQTLAVWGVNSGPYLMLPLLGPSTLRDTAGLPVDYATSPGSYVSDDELRLGLTGLGIIDTRSSVMGAEELLGASIYSDYARMREFYLKSRESKVKDGFVTDEAAQQEEFDLLDELDDIDDES